MNCLIYCYDSWRYLRNWLRNIKQFFRNIKWAYQRITKGYCDYDLWSIDNWISKLMHDALIEFESNCHGFPIEFENDKSEWNRILLSMADYFQKANIWYYDDPYNSENACLAEENKNKALELLERWYYHLWD